MPSFSRFGVVFGKGSCMKNLTLLAGFALLNLSIACTTPSKEIVSESETVTQPEQDTVVETVTEMMEMPATVGDNSMNSVDWPGTYFATLPCGHCEGIETWVTLRSNGSFELKTHHMGLNDDREEIFTGKFSWDDSGSVVTLNGLIGGAPGKYKVGENRIWHLDKDGNQIKGDLADRYILTKR